jgi:hypothetical protein
MRHSSLGQDTTTLTSLRGFSQSSSINAEIAPRLSHDRFLPNLFRFTSHPTLYKLDTDSVVK